MVRVVGPPYDGDDQQPIPASIRRHLSGRAVDVPPKDPFDWVRAHVPGLPAPWPKHTPDRDRPHWAFPHPTEGWLMTTAEVAAFLDRFESAGDEAQ